MFPAQPGWQEARFISKYILKIRSVVPFLAVIGLTSANRFK